MAEDGNIWDADLQLRIAAGVQGGLATKGYLSDGLRADHFMYFLIGEYPGCEQGNILFQYVFCAAASNTGGDTYIYAWK